MKLESSFIILFIVFSFFTNKAFSQKYSRAKVNLDSKSLLELAKLGIETDHGLIKKGQFIINDFSDFELELLETNGFDYKIIIDDVSKHYVAQNQNASRRNEFPTCDEKKYQFKSPQNYSSGSMGGYHTYSELLSVLDLMFAKYPNLISKRQAIDTFLTEEGRPIYFVKISDHPRSNEQEPKILYTSLHHAREPAGMSQMIFYMWYLLENYNSDPQVRFIVDSTSLYFVPCVNPDGYIYNERNNPNGGGLWRKNRRVIEGDTVGVDLNRNYGFEWHYDDIGSSSNMNSITYRGPEAFSEAETKALRSLSQKHNFELALNYHSYGNLVIYPWGFNDGPTPEDQSFKGIAEAMTRSNNYLAGTPIETVGYMVNGSSDDYMYGEHGTFAFTPEVGNPFAGFWPPQSDIEILNKSVLEQNIIAAQIVHSYINVELLPIEEQSFRFALKKYSLDTEPTEVSVRSLSDRVKIESAEEIILLDHLESKEFTFPFTLSGASEDIAEAEIVFSTGYPSFTVHDTFLIPISDKQFDIVFADTASNKAFWSSTIWDATSERSYEGGFSLTDSPLDDYSASSNSLLTLKEPIDLSEVKSATLSYFARWEIEEDFDYAQVRVSVNGIDFVPLCGLYTENGTAFQDFEQAIYDGRQDSWVRESINLDDYLGEEVWIQFALVSDEIEQQDGFYLDQIEVEVKNQLTSSLEDQLTLRNEDFQIVPNPFDLDFEVKNLDDREGEYRIFDHLGRRVGKEDLIPGVYYIEIWQKGKRVRTLKGISLND